MTKKNIHEKSSTKPTLLSGGNPQIPKGDGKDPVRAYIEAMPGWKDEVGEKLNEIILRTVPGVSMAVRWNTPFYGIDGRGWFIAFHCLTKYVKVTFFRGVSLEPVPPVCSKQENVRYYHISENEQLDERLLENWIEQASKLPGANIF